jgi:hypothetical protein
VLTAATAQVLRTVLRDRARRDAPAELRELAGDTVLAPQAVLPPHASDEISQLAVDRRPADPTARAVAPPQPPCRSMPPENRRRPHDITASSSERARVASVAINHRSSRRSRGRGVERRSTMSWWRSKRFSATTTARGAKNLATAATTLRRRSITERSSPPRSGTSSPVGRMRPPALAHRVSAAHNSRPSDGCPRVRDRYSRRRNGCAYSRDAWSRPRDGLSRRLDGYSYR